MRIEPALRAKIVEAAQANDETVTREVERRLRESFGDNSTSLRADLLAKAKEAAAAKGIGVQQEIEFRLDSSFREDAAGPATRRLTRLLMAVFEAIEQRTKKGWHEDTQTWLIARAAVYNLMSLENPEAAEVPPFVRELNAQYEAAKQRAAAALEAYENCRKSNPFYVEWDRMPMVERSKIIEDNSTIFDELDRLNVEVMDSREALNELVSRREEVLKARREELRVAWTRGVEASSDTMNAILGAGSPERPDWSETHEYTV